MVTFVRYITTSIITRIWSGRYAKTCEY